jgi:thymidylate synthase
MDQVDNVLWQLKNTPYSRRIMTNMYNFADLREMGLEPCAYSMTFNVTREKVNPSADSPAALDRMPEADENGERLVLNAVLNQRSNDVLTANNWNVAQYAILLMMMAQVSDMVPGELVHMIADAHIYDRHIPLIQELITRQPLKAPRVWLDPDVTDFYAFTTDHLHYENYETHEQIRNIPVAI